MPVKTFDDEQLFYADAVLGRKNGVFYAPYLPGSRLRLHGLSSEQGEFLDIAEHLYESVADLPDRDLIGLLDSGVAEDHPLLRPRISMSRDFTGEGIADASGHGTMRALKSLVTHPTARFLVAKVVGTTPGNRKALIEALKWAIDQGAGALYLALGEYNLCCRGTCPMCQAAQAAVDGHRVMIVAPGNRKGRIACPAKAMGVTPTLTTAWHDSRRLYAVERRADLTTIPARFEYHGESDSAVASDLLDLMGLSEWQGELGAGLRFLRGEFGPAKSSGRLTFLDYLREVRRFLSDALERPLPEKVAALDVIWEEVSEGLLTCLKENELGVDGEIVSLSMWVPLYAVPANWDINATIPGEVPQAARYLIVRWDLAWANLARVLGRGPSFESFHRKAASHLENYTVANPNDAEAHYQLGILYLMASDGRARCREPLLRAKELRPDWPLLSAALEAARRDRLIP